MSTINKEKFTLSIIDSTGQFSLKRNWPDGGDISVSETDNVPAAKAIIDLMKAYLLTREKSYERST